jgi:hypothetical protein
MAGVDVFDMAPVEVGRMGTMEDPIKVNSIVRSLLLPRGSSSALGERRGLLGRALERVAHGAASCASPADVIDELPGLETNRR